MILWQLSFFLLISDCLSLDFLSRNGCCGSFVSFCSAFFFCYLKQHPFTRQLPAKNSRQLTTTHCCSNSVRVSIHCNQIVEDLLGKCREFTFQTHKTHTKLCHVIRSEKFQRFNPLFFYSLQSPPIVSATSNNNRM